MPLFYWDKVQEQVVLTGLYSEINASRTTKTTHVVVFIKGGVGMETGFKSYCFVAREMASQAIPFGMAQVSKPVGSDTRLLHFRDSDLLAQ